MLSGLANHCGSDLVERTAVNNVLTPMPTKSHFPIPHSRILDEVEAFLPQAGYNIVNEAHALAKDGARYFGLLEVKNGNNADDFTLVIGVRNSHDKRFPAGLVLGAQVFVCDNLSFWGEAKIARKHTRFVDRDLPFVVNRAVGQLSEYRTNQEQRLIAYKEQEITDREAHDLLVRSMDSKVVPVTKLPKVLEQWRTPNHPEFCESKNGWRLFNAFTEVLKGNLSELPKRTQALHGLLDSHFGLLETSVN